MPASPAAAQRLQQLLDQRLVQLQREALPATVDAGVGPGIFQRLPQRVHVHVAARFQAAAAAR